MTQPSVTGDRNFLDEISLWASWKATVFIGFFVFLFVFLVFVCLLVLFYFVFLRQGFSV